MAKVLPTNPLEQAVYAGNHESVMELLRDMPEAERKSHRAGLMRMIEEISPHRIRTVQALIVAGVVPRPDTDNYYLGVMSLLYKLRPKETFDDVLAADPGLADVLLRIMDIEGTSELSLAATDKYSKAHGWTGTLLQLCERGLYSRATLLDKTLSSLERDWLQFRSGWFSRFHEALSPSIEEMKPHTSRYLALCHSRIPPTVALALSTVEKLDAAGLVNPRELLDALRPVMSSGVKGHVNTAIKLLDRVVTRDASLAAESASAVAAGLAHESADVQKQILRRLGSWGVGADLRRMLHDYEQGIAAVNRKAFLELVAGTGGAAPASTEVESAQPFAPVQIARVTLLDPSRKLAPLTTEDELVECIAHVFENDTDVDEFERAIAALVRFAPLSEDSRSRFGPVLKRATGVRKPMARELARLLCFVALGARTNAAPSRDHAGRPSPVERLLIARINDLMDLAGQGVGLLPLSAPTHLRGVIDPADFVERVAAHQERETRVPRSDQILGLLRLATGATDQVRARARELRDDMFVRALRYALGDQLEPGADVALFAAAARIRHSRSDDVALAKLHGDLGPDGALAANYAWLVKTDHFEHAGKKYAHHDFEVTAGRHVPRHTSDELMAVIRHPPVQADETVFYRWSSFGGIDEGAVTYSATLLPSDPGAFFAEGARAIGNNLVWSEAQWQNRAYLRLLLDPSVEMTDTATLLLALGLAGKEPGQTATAVDALVQAKTEGRLDETQLGKVMGALLITPMIKGARYAKSLRAALRIDADVAPVIFEVLCAALAATASNPPRDAAVLMELLQEVMLISRRALPEAARLAIGTLALGGKARALQKSLLERAAGSR